MIRKETAWNSEGNKTLGVEKGSKKQKLQIGM